MTYCKTFFDISPILLLLSRNQSSQKVQKQSHSDLLLKVKLYQVPHAILSCEVWMKEQQAPRVNDQQDFFVNFHLRLVGPYDKVLHVLYFKGHTEVED